MACSDDSTAMAPASDTDNLGGSTTSVSPEKHRRNLTKDFALCLDKSGTVATTTDGEESNATAPTSATAKEDDESEPSIFSPTSVIPPSDDTATTAATAEKKTDDEGYHFHLHQSLQRGLSQALVDRVSFYGIIHDINKEATAMAVNDPKLPDCEEDESQSPLVLAATGTELNEEEYTGFQAVASPAALIDEEAWLLETVGTRDTEERLPAVCPPTFLQAMGEREYENPMQALSGATRTQLWKPSRSWWEAKSGKNPWIEPSSHNKRWRYLWPLIHYHKFLAKCIKKLKRNGVDVKQAVSPVAVFLREEVCAVSDHLADCSRFDSDEWMECLKHFEGWTEVRAENELRKRVQLLKLRSLHEPSDVDSKLLRDQVDSHFLASMAKAREQMREGSDAASESRSKSYPPPYPRGIVSREEWVRMIGWHKKGRSRFTAQPPLHEQFETHHPPPHSPYWAWEQHSMMAPYAGDGSSVHSALSNDSGYVPHPAYPVYMHHGHPHAYYPNYYSVPMMYHPGGSTDGHFVYPEDGSEPHVWVDPASYGYHPYPTPVAVSHDGPVDFSEVSESEADFPEAEQAAEGIEEATPPVKFQGNSQQQSPYWSHLDSVAVGLATPAKSSPGTPRRNASYDNQEAEDAPGYLTTAQPLLLRGYHRSYGHYGSLDGYAPPSPATQFQMSPQASFAPTYGYSYKTFASSTKSPRKKSPQSSPDNADVTPPPPVHKVVPTQGKMRESPNTVGTTTDSDSLQGVST